MVTEQIHDQPELGTLSDSPVHGLKPLTEEPVWINIGDIDIDPTNPGSVTESMRYQRRAPSMRDSYDIFGRIVYPIIVCQNPEAAQRFIHVDGFGRLEQLKERGQERIRAYIYPPMSLEQRICFRQTLNAAQEPFDAVSIIQDLRILAKERNLDIHNVEHLKTLVRDMPEKVRKHERDILQLSRWDSGIVDLLGESYSASTRSIGLDQIRSLGRVMDVMIFRHPETLKKLGSLQAFSARLAEMHLNRRFAQDGRSQEGIRLVIRSLKTLPPDDPIILDFFENNMTCRELDQVAKANLPVETGLVVASCTNFLNMLLNVNVDRLTDDDVNALRRTATVLNGVVSEVSR